MPEALPSVDFKISDPIWQATAAAAPREVSFSPGRSKRLSQLPGLRHLHNDAAHYTTEPGEPKTRPVEMPGRLVTKVLQEELLG